MAVPASVAEPGTQLYVGLRRAINDLLTGNQSAGIPRRTPEQVISRINRRWYGQNAEERSSRDYVPADDSVGAQPIKNRSSWLAAAIIAQDCQDLSCEDGELLGTSQPCPSCQERRAQERATGQAALALQRRLDAEDKARTAARTVSEEWETAHAKQEQEIRTRLADSGMWGEKLRHGVTQHMTKWRDYNSPSAGRSALRNCTGDDGLCDRLAVIGEDQCGEHLEWERCPQCATRYRRPGHEACDRCQGAETTSGTEACGEPAPF
ncbi:hypothetical protein [Streptomyces sp. WMMC905]|uniref:hypothetical protein n=1 Tax=Streptomyces sp. WMMC905 TaxID=3404123 RepID=UPI003B93C17E